MVRYDGSLSGMMNHYRELITPESSWGWDQAILTFSLLQSGVCSLEEKSKGRFPKIGKKFWNFPIG